MASIEQSLDQRNKRVITADELRIGDVNGRHLTLSPDGLKLYGGHENEPRNVFVELSLTDMVSLTFSDFNGTTRVRLQVARDGAPTLHLRDGNGKDRLILSLDEEGAPDLELRDAQEGPRIGLTVDGEDGEAVLAFYDRTANGILRMAVDRDDQPSITAPTTHQTMPWRAAREPEAPSTSSASGKAV